MLGTESGVAGLAAAIRAGQLSSVDLVESCVERCAADETNAVVTLVADRARREAHEADAAAAAGRSLGPLHGVPFTVKDALATAGVRSTCGAAELAEHVPDEDATVVRRLRDAGAVLFAKTNTSTWCADIQTHNELFGPTTKPYDATRSAGGSSGGAAAAVAAGLSAFDVGTDIGGSLRIPAGFCGVFAHKPTYGLVPARGFLGGPLPSLVDQEVNVVGPVARTAADLELLLDVMAGPDEIAARAWTLTLPAAESLRGQRIAVWLDDGPTPVAESVHALFAIAADALRSAGAVVTEARPPIDVDRHGRLWLSTALRTMAMMHGDGDAARRQAGDHLDSLICRDESLRAASAWEEWFTGVDLLLAPVWPDAAFPLDTARTLGERTVEVDGVSVPQAVAMWWNCVVGLAGLPATAVPLGPAGGLPVGAQFVGPLFRDRRCIAAAGELSRLLSSTASPGLAHV